MKVWSFEFGNYVDFKKKLIKSKKFVCFKKSRYLVDVITKGITRPHD